MVKSVPYFKDKGDSNSSAGWKNSIRHNLSLHSKFIRVQNEGTGKSSWWMLNPEGGKSGKSPRRRAASMDNNSKFAKSREQDDLGDGDVHPMSYPPSATKMASTLPSLSEMSNSENMENLLDNLNLLSPNTSMTVSTQSSPATMMQQAPGYSFTSSTTSIGSPNPDYRKFTYVQASINSLPQMPLQTLQDSKSGYGPISQYNCSSPGLLKELLTSDSPTHNDILASVDTGVPQPSGRVLGQNVLMVSNSVMPTYGFNRRLQCKVLQTCLTAGTEKSSPKMSFTFLLVFLIKLFSLFPCVRVGSRESFPVQDVCPVFAGYVLL
ncbi:hypothetical protein Y1Q_0007617 [Alligator mississippiensis]|uniref:Fork-head domain-containing protein n=1 Tax=Alligator mississippiensis TaxID=8496 RepID=A0A151NC13_ALLMI|nr:hypothetical protein Y1Q_0007617 [Alligator mississippiensis]